MKIQRAAFLFLFINFNLFAADVKDPATDPAVVLESLKWATASNIKVLEIMAHTKLSRLVPRGRLMEKYGLPIITGSSIVTGAFDAINDKGLSGNLVNSPGAIMDLFKVAGLCGGSKPRQQSIDMLKGELKRVEDTAELKQHDINLAKKIIQNLRKLEYRGDRASFPKIEASLSKETLDPSMNYIPLSRLS